MLEQHWPPWMTLLVLILLTVLAAGLGVRQQPSASPTAVTVTSPPASSTTTSVATRGSFSVAPSILTVGKSATFAGTSCSEGDAVAVSFGGLAYTLGTLLKVRPSPDGSWKIQIQIADDTRLGRQGVVASCVNPTTRAVIFDYKDATITVRTFRILGVSSTTVAAGSSLFVSPIGSCPEPPLNYPYYAAVNLSRTPGPWEEPGSEPRRS